MTGIPPCSEANLGCGAEEETTVYVDGEIDIVTVDEFRRRLLGSLSGGCRHMTVDLSGVSFLGVCGLSAMAELIDVLRQRDGNLVLRDPAPIVRKLVMASGLADLLQLDPPCPEDDGGR